MTSHRDNKTECCESHVACGPGCDGVSEAQCKDCGVETCSSCAAWFDIDGDADESGEFTTVSARCKDCQEAKVVFEALTGKKWGAEAAVAFYAGVRS